MEEVQKFWQAPQFCVKLHCCIFSAYLLPNNVKQPSVKGPCLMWSTSHVKSVYVRALFRTVSEIQLFFHSTVPILLIRNIM
jgi:hypothetical protein